MIVKNRKKFIPILAWTLLSVGTFLLALAQERSALGAVPAVNLRSAFSWVAGFLLLYLLLVWPLSLEEIVEKFARQPLTQWNYSVLALQEPGLLVLYVLPVLVLAAIFSFKGLAEILQAVFILLVTATGVWAHFRLGFYFHGSMTKPYYFAAGILCIVIPGANLVYDARLGEGPTWLNALNPFHALFRVTGAVEGGGGVFLTFVLVFGGLALVLLVLPLVFALQPRAYIDMSGGG